MLARDPRQRLSISTQSKSLPSLAVASFHHATADISPSTPVTLASASSTTNYYPHNYFRRFQIEQPAPDRSTSATAGTSPLASPTRTVSSDNLSQNKDESDAVTPTAAGQKDRAYPFGNSERPTQKSTKELPRDSVGGCSAITDISVHPNESIFTSQSGQSSRSESIQHIALEPGPKDGQQLSQPLWIHKKHINQRRLSLQDNLQSSRNHSSTTLQPLQLSNSLPTHSTIMAENTKKDHGPGPPGIGVVTETTDIYGFRTASRDYEPQAYARWHKEYLVTQERRRKRWRSFMSSHGLPTTDPKVFPGKSNKTRRFVRKGIPPEWRGEAWLFYSGAAQVMRDNVGGYDNFLKQAQGPALSVKDSDAIERDLHRTFPDNVHYKSQIQSQSQTQTQSPSSPPSTLQPYDAETPLTGSLRRVLQAFAISHHRVGYCQSLNFLAGLLLLFLPEEKAFWLLHIIITRYLPGTHELSLEGANIDLWVLMLSVKDSLPLIWSKFGDDLNNTSRPPPISLCTIPWFMSLFIGTLPIETVLRTWDVIFYEGSRTIFRIALALFKLGEDDIRRLQDPMDIFQLVQSYPRKILDPSPLLKLAFARSPVSQAWIDRKRSERRAWYAAQRQKMQERENGSGSKEGDNGPRASSSNGIVNRPGGLVRSQSTSLKSPGRKGWHLGPIGKRHANEH